METNTNVLIFVFVTPVIKFIQFWWCLLISLTHHYAQLLHQTMLISAASTHEFELEHGIIKVFHHVLYHTSGLWAASDCDKHRAAQEPCKMMYPHRCGDTTVILMGLPGRFLKKLSFNRDSPLLTLYHDFLVIWLSRLEMVV